MGSVARFAESYARWLRYRREPVTAWWLHKAKEGRDNVEDIYNQFEASPATWWACDAGCSGLRPQEIPRRGRGRTRCHVVACRCAVPKKSAVGPSGADSQMVQVFNKGLPDFCTLQYTQNMSFESRDWIMTRLRALTRQARSKRLQSSISLMKEVELAR